jgi:hypothetical protein
MVVLLTWLDLMKMCTWYFFHEPFELAFDSSMTSLEFMFIECVDNQFIIVLLFHEVSEKKSWENLTLFNEANKANDFFFLL